MGVYRRHNRLWIRYAAGGKLVRKPTPYRPGQESLARQALEIARAAEEAGAIYADPLTGVVTVDRFAREWLRNREADKIATWKDDRGRLNKHVLPRIGGMKIAEVRPRHLVALFAELRRKKNPPSPKTIRNINGTLGAMFRIAQMMDQVVTTPCILTSRELGSLEQRDPLARVAELYTHAEVERLLSAPEIEFDRRLFYGCEALGGLRLGEVAGLRWKHIDAQAEPLGRIAIVTSYDTGRTKTSRARYVPIHPTLAAMLAEWRLAWPGIYGHQPEPEDRVLGAIKKPGKGRRAPTGGLRTKSMVGKAFRVDLATLELTHRRGHDLRSTFITLAEHDGANPDIIQDVTHTSRQNRRGSFEVYLRRHWDTLCAEVAKLKITRRGPAEIRRLAAAGAHPAAQSDS